MTSYSTSAVRGLAAIAAAGLLAACGAGSAGTSGGQPKTAGGPVISARTVSGIGALLACLSCRAEYEELLVVRDLLDRLAGPDGVH